MKKIFSVLIILVFAIFIFSCGNDNGSNVPVDSASGKNKMAMGGKDIFSANCVSCHGEDGKAGVMGAKDLSLSTIDHATAVSIVKSGKGMMKSFSGQLSDTDIDAVVKYAESLRK
ncbi:MAG: c-type cytochrome [Bacteroidetes bacterium]|nr:c-type cytochrome [Bacteroidota bacterium]